YAWEKKQWDQLLLDLQEQVMSELNDGKPIDDVEHFFGPIVVLERVGGAPELKEFTVIDGQQRITTIYLLLSVIRDLILSKKHLSIDADDYVAQINKLVVNDLRASDDYLKLKVFSSKGDRLPTYRVVFGTDANPVTPMLQTDLQLYIPGKNRVDEFHRYATRKIAAAYRDIPSLWLLATGILDCLKIVWIPLDQERDDPQAIFESLNDKGIPLTASELLCNYLFRPIIEAKESFEILHNNQWLAAIRLLGSDSEFEEYLRNLFSIGETKMVGKGRKLYTHFKGKNKRLSPAVSKEHLVNIYEGATLFKSIRDPLTHPYKDGVINNLLVSIGNTRMGSSTPFVLSVLSAHSKGTLDSVSARAILQEALILLVRRKMTEAATTQYDTMFPPLLGKIINETNLVRALHEQFRSNNVWVSDQEFAFALINRATYRERDLSFSRMILTGINTALEDHGQLPDYSTINTIEHMLPQTLDDGWKKYLGTEADDEHLGVLTDSLGNLCLLSRSANSAVGQDPFVSKRDDYSPLTALARQVKCFEGKWDLNAIKQRSKVLSETALKVWPWSTV
ncbi:MAG: DUF262 domain-containing protein, partial [Rhabdochlamydiaceae bacterium]